MTFSSGRCTLTDGADGSVAVEEYHPDMGPEALQLEASCTQGGSFRLGFRRVAFHRRAENFAVHRILVARLGRRMAGVVAVAIKPVELYRRQTSAAFLFDLRVHPSLRGRGIGQRLSSEAIAWGLGRAEIAYTYTMSDNRVVSYLSALFDATDVGSYCYSVIPTGRALPAPLQPARACFREVHEAMRGVSGGFDLYADPSAAMEGGGYVASWMARSGRAVAGCSAWTNREILAEVVESVPLELRALRSLARAFPRFGARFPRIPGDGEVLSSWYLFDYFSTDAALGQDLLRHVASEARGQGVDYLYLSHAPGDPHARAARRDQLISPLIRYRLLARRRDGATPRIDRFYVDVRDL